jgi:hypothetical protein
VPNNLTDALLIAFASAEPADEPVLDFLSLINGDEEGDIFAFVVVVAVGILTAFDVAALLGDFDNFLSFNGVDRGGVAFSSTKSEFVSFMQNINKKYIYIYIYIKLTISKLICFN